MRKLLNTAGYAATMGLGFAAATESMVRTGWRMDPHPMPHQFASWLDNPLRRKYRDPDETIGLYGVQPGMTVLDAGCGIGLFTTAMARMVGAQGAVHAVDVQYPCLVAAGQRLEQAGLAERVELHHGGLYHLPLDDDSVDIAVLIATLGEIPSPLLALSEIGRVLKIGARIIVSEELLDPAYLPDRFVKQYMEEAGFRYGGKNGNSFCYSLIYFNDSSAATVTSPSVESAWAIPKSHR